MDLLDSVVRGAEGELKSLSLVLQVLIEAAQVFDLCLVVLFQLILALLESGYQAGDESEDVVQGLGVDLGTHFHEALDDRLEESEGALLGVGLQNLLDFGEVLLGLDKGHLRFLAYLDERRALGTEVHEESLGFLAGENGVAVVLELRGVVGVLGI